MFAEERLEKIIRLLNDRGKVVVKELSEIFEVTEDCIRKDLKTLEKDGLIKRTYGGAVLNRQSAANSNIVNRRSLNIEAKRTIAEKAFEIIMPNETIFLDISTTNILIAEKLAGGNKRVTVVTNMIDVINAFSKSDHVKVIGTGGVYYKELDGFVGSTAIETISRYKVDKAFIGSVGVNIFDKSVTTFDIEDGNTKRAIISAGKSVYLVMESKKFYMDGVYKFADLFDIDAVIVDTDPEEQILKELEKADVEII
ncbi:DeoR/GlpR family DNA-binding transcription regulator [Geosporobacter ferrireducens]|uniref:DeoR family transcriptional regulator n=1 Tax=Geosporobacter ferrireducens TaxID=1424294 RepID=A0A1D8GDA0_9FIRM|nr:DeoR/GlpR family DNA-binding transcription regulator [Geosporobacter ferrireducens]AOT68874.1 DeoR family transcriptional regulator [Geosporobacter ferrireducens]MTI54893.1 DeoR/GlpR transcriptional regulator [Geosporobacter ferrireducens]